MFSVVYHLLTADQVKRWEQFEYEYYADELTLQVKYTYQPTCSVLLRMCV